MTRRLFVPIMLAALVFAGSAAFVASCQPPPPPSWGCGQSVSHYGDDNTKMELNTQVFAPVQPFSSNICGNNQVFYADMKAGECGGCVQAYPSIIYRYDQSSWVGCCAGPPSWIGGSIPLPSVKAWTSSWAVTFDHSTNSQAAYDLWFRNNCGALGKTENGDLMIWVDTTASRGTGGGPVRNPHLQLDGRDITFMQYGTPGVDTTETIYKFNTNEPSGSVNLMAFVNHAISTGDLKACDSRGLMIGNADFGYEVAGTQGAVKRFSVNDFHFDVTTNDGVHHR